MKIFMIGFMGCGKTHWGKLLSEKLKVPFFDLDAMIEEREGKPITEIFSEMGEEYFRMLEKDVLHLVTESHETFVMACGGGTPCFFNTIDYMKRKGTTVWIHCSTDCLYQRLMKEKASRPLIRSIPNDELRAYIIKKYADRKIFYQQATVILSDEEVTLEKLIEKTFHS
ncbi:MAG TPA: shikimate kinase [Flavisolibacter sp.]|jgi:shikimate kinase|nr:shikimate kinase [Flavisolibacter sp.]